jgi:OFA family oxalate/formate antiporter-like MFS transporter
VIAAGILANACCGAGYAFSVIKGPLMAVLGRTDAEVSLAYSLSAFFLPAGMLLAGAICARRGPRFAIALGGIVFGTGMLLAGFSRSLGWLYATYGAMVSVGQGLSYGTVIATAVRWFPDRRGLASGLVVSALGIGTLVVAPLYQGMIGGDPTRVLYALKALGIGFVLIIGTASRFVTDPPKDYAPAAAMLRGKRPPEASSGGFGEYRRAISTIWRTSSA